MADVPLVDYYMILEIDEKAGEAQIREAVKNQRRLWYKRQDAPTPEKRREAEDRMHVISDAERILLNPAERAAYDQKLRTRIPEPDTADAAGDTGPSTDWTGRAADYLRNGRVEAAHGAAREATDRKGSDHEAWAIRGRASLLMNQADSAVFEFGEAIRLRPGSDEYRFDLGGAFEAKRDYDRALSSYREAADLAPANRGYRISMASVYLQADQPEQALGVLDPLHDAEPRDEICNFYLAMALSDATFNRWTQVGPDRYLITTKEQAALGNRNLRRAFALEFDDDGLRNHLLDSLRLVKESEALVFRMPGTRAASGVNGGGCLVAIGYLIVFGILSSAMSSNAFIGLAVIAGAGYAWYQLAFQPRWKRNAQDLRAVGGVVGNG
jgi:tetratricopeptide (TPR) repeat protein